MGKVSKPKKNRSISDRSRAARRAVTPPEDGRKAKSSRAETENEIENVIARQGGGITKKTKQKPLSRQQRMRKERSMEKAAAVAEQLEVKVDKSKESMKKIKNRSIAWDELNGTAAQRFQKAQDALMSGAASTMDMDDSQESHEEEEEQTTLPDPRMALVMGGAADGEDNSEDDQVS